jgi:hypothetical protein
MTHYIFLKRNLDVSINKEFNIDMCGECKPTNGILASKSAWLCDVSISQEFYRARKNVLSRLKRSKINFQSPKTEFRSQKC